MRFLFWGKKNDETDILNNNNNNLEHDTTTNNIAKIKPKILYEKLTFYQSKRKIILYSIITTIFLFLIFVIFVGTISMLNYLRNTNNELQIEQIKMQEDLIELSQFHKELAKYNNVEQKISKSFYIYNGLIFEDLIKNLESYLKEDADIKDLTIESKDLTFTINNDLVKNILVNPNYQIGVKLISKELTLKYNSKYENIFEIITAILQYYPGYKIITFVSSEPIDNNAKYYLFNNKFKKGKGAEQMKTTRLKNTLKIIWLIAII